MFRPNQPFRGIAIPDEKEIIYNNADDYYQALLHDIDQAEKTIDMETFIFSNDFLGECVAEHLANAAKRGVKIRLLIDGMGALFWGSGIEKTLTDAGIDWRVYHPAPWRLWQWKHSNYLNKHIMLRAMHFLAAVNSRNHRKITVVDNKIAWIGSVNVTASHLSKQQGGEDWRDTCVRMKDLDFRDLTLALEAEFYGEHYQRLFNTELYNRIFRLNNTLFRRRYTYRGMLRKIRRARERIWITNAYFVPDIRLLRVLREAAWIGVDVRVMFPANNNHIFMNWASSVFYEALLKAGIKIFEYLPGMLHAKSMIVDDWFIVGSSNLNHRSVFRDFEVDVVISANKAKLDLENNYVDDLEHSRQITLTSFERHSFLKRMMGHVALLFRYFL
tara:strand:+ start:45611 stop:46771 length:1161 start_codon:yes stop_codon:yes gene_type:complete